jgi:hypothetical protein
MKPERKHDAVQVAAWQQKGQPVFGIARVPSRQDGAANSLAKLTTAEESVPARDASGSKQDSWQKRGFRSKRS